MNDYKSDVILGLAYQLRGLDENLKLDDAIAQVRKDLDTMDVIIIDESKDKQAEIDADQQIRRDLLGMIVMMVVLEAWSPVEIDLYISLAVFGFIEKKKKLGEQFEWEGFSFKIVYPPRNATLGLDPARITATHIEGLLQTDEN